jgi:hypothetical protein
VSQLEQWWERSADAVYEVVPGALVASNPWHDESGLFARKGGGGGGGGVQAVPFENKRGKIAPNQPVSNARPDGTLEPVRNGTYRGLSEAGKPVVELHGGGVIEADPGPLRAAGPIGKGLESYGPEVERNAVDTEALANPYHDESGLFARKGGGKGGGSAAAPAVASGGELAAVQAQGQAKARQAPKPTEGDVVQGSVDALLAREGLVRAGGDRRGNNVDRAKRSSALADEFGHSRDDTCACADCGVRVAGSQATAKRLGISVLTQDKIVTGPQGGKYTPANLLATCKACNQTRGNRHDVGVGSSVKPKWGDPETYARKVRRANKQVIAQRFQARRATILARQGITIEDHVSTHPNAMPSDWSGKQLPAGFVTEDLDGVWIDDVAADEVLGVADPVAVDRTGGEWALDVDGIEGDVAVGVHVLVPAGPLGPYVVAVDSHDAEFANPWHDETGRFARKGGGAGGGGIVADANAAMAERARTMDAAKAAEDRYEGLRKRSFLGGTPEDAARTEAAKTEFYDAQRVASEANGRVGDVIWEATDADLTKLGEDPSVHPDLMWAVRNEQKRRAVAANPPPPPPPNRQQLNGSKQVHEDLVREAGEDWGVRGQTHTDWAGEGYRTVQSDLHNGRISSWSRPVVEDMDASMMTRAVPTTLYRGQSHGLDGLQVGQVLRAKTYQSLTADPVLAMDYSKSAGGVTGRARVDQSYPVLRVTVPAGGRLAPVVSSSAELETVLHRDSKMTVTGRDKVDTPDGPIEVIDVRVDSF